MRLRPAAPADPAQGSLFAVESEQLSAEVVAANPPSRRPAQPAAPARARPAPPTPSTPAHPEAPGRPAPPSLGNPAPSAPVHAALLAPADSAEWSDFHHPRADRDIALGEHRIGYAFKRVRRRSIGFIVGPEGLSVNAPKWVGVREVEAALRAKGDWIVQKLVEQRERARRQQAARIAWRDGASIPFLGETVVLVLDTRAGAAPGGALLETDDRTEPGTTRRLTLRVALAPAAPPDRIGSAVQGWLQRQARRVFEERCRLYAERIGVRMNRLGLSSAQTRWGSANANGAIRLNWRLIHFALSTIDYVVVHELAHLREMNHGPRFWRLVGSVLPDYERARASLKHDALPVFD